MSSSKVIVILLFFVIPSMTIYSCKENDLSPQEAIKANLLNSTWKIKTVSVDEIDSTSSYNGMTIIFTETEYKVTNGGLVWPVSGTWNFNSPDGQKIIRNDGIEVTISVTPTRLEMLLEWSSKGFGPGRTSSTKGKRKFTFVK